MKRIAEQVSLAGKFEVITVGELRKTPGEVMASVALGKTFLITKNGAAMAVLSKPPGVALTIHVGPTGETTYRL